MLFTQAETIEMFKELPYQTYQKFGKVKFAIAQHKQEVVTVLNGEVETKNIANKGDYVIEGINGEFYVNTPTKFDKNYAVISLNSGFTGEAEVLPQPRYAIEWKIQSFKFKAAWGEEMICNKGDYLVAPQDLSEVYRIEQQTFLNTYKKVQDAD